MTAYTHYLTVRPKSSISAFILQDGTPINTRFVTKHIGSVLDFLGHNSSDFTNHSFRIRKATDMSRRGFTDTQICLAGRWSSSAFRKYIKPQNSEVSGLITANTQTFLAGSIGFTAVVGPLLSRVGRYAGISKARLSSSNL